MATLEKMPGSVRAIPWLWGQPHPGDFPLCPVFILIIQGTTWLGSQKVECIRAGLQLPLANTLSHYLLLPWDILWPHRDLAFPGLPVFIPHQMKLAAVALAEFIRGGKSPNHDHPSTYLSALEDPPQAPKTGKLCPGSLLHSHMVSVPRSEAP